MCENRDTIPGKVGSTYITTEMQKGKRLLNIADYHYYLERRGSKNYWCCIRKAKEKCKGCCLGESTGDGEWLLKSTGHFQGPSIERFEEVQVQCTIKRCPETTEEESCRIVKEIPSLAFVPPDDIIPTFSVIESDMTDYGKPLCHNGTSVNNLSCIIYDISCLNCTWNIGAKSPKDTYYSMFYEHEMNIEKCSQYMKDDWKRHTGCHICNVKLHFKPDAKITVYINGSSVQTAIQPYDELFNIYVIEKLSRPSNITTIMHEDSFTLQWDTPPTNHKFLPYCYMYQIKMMDTKLKEEKIYTTEDNIFRMKTDKQHYAVQLRANGHTRCRDVGLWSEWSETIYIGVKEVDTFLYLLPITIAWSLLGIIIMCLCRRNRECTLSHL
ncbi:interleukin-5 receptor subunit alpha [Protopterus annectens]|uniref:interleukin-5 receptor subunit alpha n=1 Tax=Protopterus annectens TaxID=7888 RepID=UPI001CFB19EA|nr:interleukin-5 receptor subunit alpha [Protopterus annectens]